MENATKALIIAGGVLLGILILSIGVYTVLQFSNFAESFDDRVEQDRKLAFNNKFLVYARDITSQEMVTLINLVKEENSKNPELQIEVIVGGKNYLTLDENAKINLMKSENATTPTFKLEKVEYNDANGFVKKISFKKS